MATSTESARLRVVGQELERRKIFDFDVTVERDGYRVRGCVPRGTANSASKAARTLRDLFRRTPETADEPRNPESETWEQTYSTSDIERLDGWHKAQRVKAGEPDGYATSQVLRVVGAYVEQRKWVLAGVSRTRQMIEIRYRDARGELQISGQNYSELYDFCFHMSRARKDDAESTESLGRW